MLSPAKIFTSLLVSLPLRAEYSCAIERLCMREDAVPVHKHDENVHSEGCRPTVRFPCHQSIQEVSEVWIVNQHFVFNLEELGERERYVLHLCHFLEH